MQKGSICVSDHNDNQRATIHSDGESIHLYARGKKLQVSEGELYDLIILFMSQFYQDFMENTE